MSQMWRFSWTDPEDPDVFEQVDTTIERVHEDAADIIQRVLDKQDEEMGFTHEFLEYAPPSILLRDGPFIVLRGRKQDGCYEIIEDDFLKQMIYGKLVKLIDHT